MHTQNTPMTLKIAPIYPFSPQGLNYSGRGWESSQVPLGPTGFWQNRTIGRNCI